MSCTFESSLLVLRVILILTLDFTSFSSKLSKVSSSLSVRRLPAVLPFIFLDAKNSVCLLAVSRWSSIQVKMFDDSMIEKSLDLDANYGLFIIVCV